jgi:hypothetical protein
MYVYTGYNSCGEVGGHVVHYLDTLYLNGFSYLTDTDTVHAPLRKLHRGIQTVTVLPKILKLIFMKQKTMTSFL